MENVACVHLTPRLALNFMLGPSRMKSPKAAQRKNAGRVRAMTIAHHHQQLLEEMASDPETCQVCGGWLGRQRGKPPFCTATNCPGHFALEHAGCRLPPTGPRTEGKTGAEDAAEAFQAAAPAKATRETSPVNRLDSRASHSRIKIEDVHAFEDAFLTRLTRLNLALERDAEREEVDTLHDSLPAKEVYRAQYRHLEIQERATLRQVVQTSSG
jgi:hypothetical protein